MPALPIRVLIAFSILLPAPLLAQNDNAIYVAGHGEVFAEPDTADVTFSIQGQADSARAVTERADRIAAQLVEALESLGVAARDIRSTPTNLHPFRDQQTQRERIRFDRTTSVTLRNLERLEAVQQAALDAGVNAVSGTRFGLSDRRELFNRATELALKDARSQAETVARAVDVGLGPVLSVKVSHPNGFPRPVVRELAMATDSAPDFRTGTVAVTADVEVRYAIERR